MITFLMKHKDQIEFIGTVIGVIVAFWGLITAIETFRRYYQDRREKLLSEAITSYVATDNTSQLSALQILCTQCRYSYEQVFYLCAGTGDMAIRNTLMKELKRWSTRHIRFLQSINTDMATCYLRKQWESKENDIVLSNRDIHILQDDVPFTKTELDRRDKLFHTDVQSDKPVNIESILFLSSYLLTEALSKRRVRLPIKSKTQLFYLSEFYKKKLKRTTFDHCVMINCVSRHLDAKNVHFLECQHTRDSMIDAKFSLCRFNDCAMCDTKLIEARFIRCIFHKMTFKDQTDLGKALFFRCVFHDAVEFAYGLYNGIQFVNCTFEFISIDVAEMKGVSFVNCTMKQFRIRGGFISAAFDHCEFGASLFEESSMHATSIQNRDFAFEGCSMNGTCFQNCTFAKGHLFGNDMEGVVFQDCRFTEKIAHYNNKNVEHVMVRETHLKSTSSTKLADHPSFYENKPKESPAGNPETK